MPSIAPVVSENVDPKVAATLSQLKASLGKVPLEGKRMTGAEEVISAGNAD